MKLTLLVIIGEMSIMFSSLPSPNKLCTISKETIHKVRTCPDLNTILEGL